MDRKSKSRNTSANDDHDLIISLATFNMGNAQIDYIEDIVSFEGGNADIIAFGVQESAYNAIGQSKVLKSGRDEELEKSEVDASKKTSALKYASSSVGFTLNSTLESEIERVLGDEFYLVGLCMIIVALALY